MKIPNSKELAQNVIAGVIVSFVALSLGASFGILSGRENGAFVGMVSAGLIAFVVSLLGGTRVQCSGPTAPMTAVVAAVVAFAHTQFAALFPSGNIEHFINLVLIIAGVFMLVMAVFRLGRFIKFVPQLVVSGFMSGIAILIWLDQIKKLLGLRGATSFEGDKWVNLAVALATLATIVIVPFLAKRIAPRYESYFSPTLLSIVIVSAASNLLKLDIEHVNLASTISTWGDIGTLIVNSIPLDWNLSVIWMAVPFALQLAFLAYLDTLLTSLVIDKITGERTKQSKELMAHGFAFGAVSLIGGIPGAQATIRSVLIIKENATLRLAGILVGIFVLIEVALFKELINLIPQAVFAGVLFKVGYDVFDFMPFKIYWQELKKLKIGLIKDFFSNHASAEKFVTNREMLMIIGTILFTLYFNLNIAVITFTAIFYIANKVLWRTNPIRDLKLMEETEAMIGEPIIEDVKELREGE